MPLTPMPRCFTLSVTEREHLLVLSESPEEFIRLYTVSEAALLLIQQHRGAARRSLGITYGMARWFGQYLIPDGFFGF